MTSETQILTSDEIQTKLNKKANNRKLMIRILPFSGLFFLIILFALTTNGKFFDTVNFSNLINQCYMLTIIAVGAAFIYAAGMIDLSVGAVLALSQLMAAYILRGHYAPVWVAIIVALATAVACYSISAIIHLLLRVPFIIVSICMMTICTGIVTLAVEDADIYIPYSELSYLNSTMVRLIVLVIIIVAGTLIFTYTRCGKDLKAIGGNSVAAKQSGVNLNKAIWLAFVMMGLCVGISSFFMLIRVGSVSAMSGNGIQLNIIVAIVLGGFPLMGGANAKVWKPIIGALMVTVLKNGLVLMGLDPAWAIFVQGVLFLLIVALTYEKSKGKLVH